MPADPVSTWLSAQGIDVMTAVEGLAVCMCVALVWGLCLNLTDRLRR